MQLSKRLQMNVSLVPEGSQVADIGCDHGYAAIWLVQQERAKRVIALDVNEGPIQHAAAHVAQYGLASRIECRLSDGTKEIKPGEVDTLMIAGMGGPLMIRILKEGTQVLEHVKTLVLQPQSEMGEVRRYLAMIGYEIEEEKACVDEGKYYFAMRAQYTGNVVSWEKEPDWKCWYGTYLAEQSDKILIEYLEKEQKVCLAIRKNMEEHHVSEERQKELQHKLQQIMLCRKECDKNGKNTNYGGGNTDFV